MQIVELSILCDILPIFPICQILFPEIKCFVFWGIESLFYAKQGIMYRPNALTFCPEFIKIGQKIQCWTKRSRYMKKIISLFLAVLILAGSCTAFAASNEDASAQGRDFPQAGFRYVTPWPDLEGELVWYPAS